MAEAHLRGRISLDGRQAERAIDGVVDRINRFESATKKAAKAFGLIFLTHQIQRGISAVSDHIKEIQQLERQYNLTAEQAQKLQRLSVELGVPVGELATKWKEAGVSIGKTLDKATQLKNQGFLTDSEIEKAREAQKAVDRAKLGATSLAARKFAEGSGEDSGLLEKSSVFRWFQNLFGDSPENRKAQSGSPAIPPVPEGKTPSQDVEVWSSILTKTFTKIPGASLNSLQQVGAFSNPNAGPMTIMREQLSELKEIKSNTSKLGKESIHE